MNKCSNFVKENGAIKFLPLIGGFLAVLVIAFLVIGFKNVSQNNKPPLIKENVNASTMKINKDINKGFEFYIGDKKTTKIKYEVESAEVVSEITVKGQQVKAAEEKMFLIFNLKITNEGKAGIQINTRDFLRLSVKDRKEKLAADIHNDPVEVQAISTKYTRLGFVVNKTDKNFQISLGEIDGPKTDFDLDL